MRLYFLVICVHLARTEYRVAVVFGCWGGVDCVYLALLAHFHEFRRHFVASWALLYNPFLAV